MKCVELSQGLQKRGKGWANKMKTRGVHRKPLRRAAADRCRKCQPTAPIKHQVELALVSGGFSFWEHQQPHRGRWTEKDLTRASQIADKTSAIEGVSTCRTQITAAHHPATAIRLSLHRPGKYFSQGLNKLSIAARLGRTSASTTLRDR
eukprot:23008-Rhodomonas_salina.4